MSDYGCLARFPDAARLKEAAQALREFGYTRLEAYSPHSVDGLAEVLDGARNRVAPVVFLGGLLGGGGTLFLEWYSDVIDYPVNIGGRPFASWPAFVPAALEATLLGAFLAGLVVLLVGTGLPRLNHPLFAARRFEAATDDGFFLVVRGDDPAYDAERVEADLARLAPLDLQRVPE